MPPKSVERVISSSATSVNGSVISTLTRWTSGGTIPLALHPKKAFYRLAVPKPKGRTIQSTSDFPAFAGPEPFDQRICSDDKACAGHARRPKSAPCKPPRKQRREDGFGEVDQCSTRGIDLGLEEN